MKKKFLALATAVVMLASATPAFACAAAINSSARILVASVELPTTSDISRRFSGGKEWFYRSLCG